MSIARQLHQLQEVDQEIEACEQALIRIAKQLTDDLGLASARTRLESERQRLEDLLKQQRSTEWEVADLTSKVKDIEARLYSGRITSPKELGNLQNEAAALSAKRSQLEDRVLDIMERTEKIEASIVTVKQGISELEAETRRQQAELTREREQVTAKLAGLKSRREELVSGIERQVADLYDLLRSRKGTAVARVEQGTCTACRIQVSVAKLQQVRAGSPVQCSNCGRILFLA